MELILHKVCGHPAQQAVTLRRCTPDEAPAVYALQNEVHAAMPHPSGSLPTRWNISPVISPTACASGVAGQSAGRVPDLPLLRPEPAQLCGFSGCAAGRVAPLGQCRQRCGAPGLAGNGLQRRMLEAALPLLPESITHLGATVSPANPYSLSNALACGFTIRARREMYGGFDRYLLAKEL